MSTEKTEIAIIGAGPNGLAAAIEMAKNGFKPVVYEMANTPGGGLRTAELTIPGYYHDICSAILPLGAASPFFKSLNLCKYGLEWIHPKIPLAHPFDDGTAAILSRSIQETIDSLSLLDRVAYENLTAPLLEEWETLMTELLSPLHFPVSRGLMKFGLKAILPASILSRTLFRGYRARGLLAGLCAHSFLQLNKASSSVFGIILGLLGHSVGWPMIKGGSNKLTDALVSRLIESGGNIKTGRLIKKVTELSDTRCILLDVTPRQLLKMTPGLGILHRTLYAMYHYGPAAFKIDWALNNPIPWRSPECKRAGTVHIGGTIEEIEKSEHDVAAGRHPQRPFVIVAQQSLFDSTRAPKGKHTGWAYCHVPNGSKFDMTQRIEDQIERFAPGFRECIIARKVMNAADHETYNPNFIGGDINGGSLSSLQLFLRPIPRFDFYSTGINGLFLCSSSTPPGPGVHGMCGYHAAHAALRKLEH